MTPTASIEVEMLKRDADTFMQDVIKNRLSEAEVNELLGIRITPVPLYFLAEDEILVVDEDTTRGIPTDTARWAVCTYGDIYDVTDNVEALLNYARQNPSRKFIVTTIGCGTMSGGPGRYNPEIMAEMFFNSPNGLPENIWLPKEFWDARKLMYPKRKERPLQFIQISDSSGSGWHQPLVIGPSVIDNSSVLRYDPSLIYQTSPSGLRFNTCPLDQINEVRVTNDYSRWGDRIDAVFDDGTVLCHQSSPHKWNVPMVYLPRIQAYIPEDFANYIKQNKQ